jgi:hypothetical protein
MSAMSPQRPSTQAPHHRKSATAPWLLAAVLSCLPALASAAGPEISPVLAASRYDSDYPTIPYAGVAKHNAFARLQEKLERGEVKLEYKPGRGYLDSLLKALKIDPSSQIMVYSKTSLQIDGITAATPRAVYYNEEAYVGFVQNMPLLELAAQDDELGLVYYTLDNRQSPKKQFDREGGRCLTCHDTYSMMGGGVPRVVVLSALIDGASNPQGRETSEDVNDQTPIRDRWGGWYVTGLTGTQRHLGALPTDNDPYLVGKPETQRFNIKDVDGLINSKPYITNKSDVVSLMVLEHQTNIQNLFTRANFKVRTVMSRNAQVSSQVSNQASSDAAPRTWEEMSGRNQNVLKVMIEPLVKAMFFVDAVGLGSPFQGTAGFDVWFQSQGPRDKKGRSLRELDLKNKVFRYPLSYMVYSPGFESLPPVVKEYVFRRIGEVLQGQDHSGVYDFILEEDRKAALEILLATKPDFARMMATGSLASR